MDVALSGIYLLLGVIIGSFSAWLAKEKGREAGGWFALGFFFNFLALFTLIGAPSKRP